VMVEIFSFFISVQSARNYARALTYFFGFWEITSFIMFTRVDLDQKIKGFFRAKPLIYKYLPAVMGNLCGEPNPEIFRP
jgi:hypothetical protein